MITKIQKNDGHKELRTTRQYYSVPLLWRAFLFLGLFSVGGFWPVGVFPPFSFLIGGSPYFFLVKTLA
jgi:hypothetical protein